MTHVHVVTAVTRPWNLPLIAGSLANAAAAADMEITWHWRLDLDREHTGGQQVKNAILDGIRDGWVWFLDDDTLAHPAILARLALLPIEAQAMIVSQQRTDGRVLHAAPENVRVGSIDVGQAIVARDLIGEHRLPDSYEGDGMLLERILPDACVAYVDEVLSYHNALAHR